MLKVINKTKKKVISQDVIEAKAWKEKVFGLLLYKNPQGMLLHTRFGIHTFGMRYPIDVLVLDNEGRVVKMKENLLPNRIFLWNPRYATVMELPSMTISKTRTTLYDYLAYEYLAGESS